MKGGKKSDWTLEWHISVGEKKNEKIKCEITSSRLDKDATAEDSGVISEMNTFIFISSRIGNDPQGEDRGSTLALGMVQ